MQLSSLGFPLEVCVEAYLACDRNVEAAANYLYESIQFVCLKERDEKRKSEK